MVLGPIDKLFGWLASLIFRREQHREYRRGGVGTGIMGALRGTPRERPKPGRYREAVIQARPKRSIPMPKRLVMARVQATGTTPILGRHMARTGKTFHRRLRRPR